MQRWSIMVRVGALLRYLMDWVDWIGPSWWSLEVRDKHDIGLSLLTPQREVA